jgi:glutaredoxin 3
VAVPILIYESPTCQFCRLAKQMLTRKGVLFESIIVDSQARQEEMVARSGRDSVPQIFIGDRHIGGYSDLAELDSFDELDPLLV